jgi:hypothetical protein
MVGSVGIGNVWRRTGGSQRPRLTAQGVPPDLLTLNEQRDSVPTMMTAHPSGDVSMGATLSADDLSQDSAESLRPVRIHREYRASSDPAAEIQVSSELHDGVIIETRVLPEFTARTIQLD